MARHLIIHCALIAFCMNSALAQPGAVQPAQQARPDLRPGDRLEVIDMGRLRDAEFVEFTPVGLIKVRFDDDSQLSFRPTHVRWAKGINPRDPKAPATAAVRPKKSPPAATAPDNPLAAQPAAAAIVAKRNWKDVSGQFSVAAEFVGLADNKVSLKKSDGKVIAIPLEKLATADQQIAKSLAERAANPFEAKVEDPAAIADSAGPEEGGVEQISYRGTRWAPQLSPNTPWQGRPDPKPGNLPALQTQTKFFPLTEGIWEQVAGLDDVNHQAWIMVGPGVGQGKNNTKPIWFERIDLRTGELRTKVPTDHDWDRLASVSPSGKLAAIVHGNFDEVITIVDISAAEPRIVRKIRPFHKQAMLGPNLTPYAGEYQVRDAIFLDDENLVVQRVGFDLALIDLKTANAKYRLTVNGPIVESPNRKHLAVISFNAGGVSLVEALTGKDLGRLEGPSQRTYSRMAFHPDGTRLAGANFNRAAAWDLGTGKQVAAWNDVKVHDERVFAHLGFGTDHDHLVIRGKNVFSLKTGTIVSQVPENSHFSSSFTHAGRQWYLVFQERRSGLNLERELRMESLALPAQ